MPENIREIQQEDIQTPEQEKGECLEIEKTPELNKVADNLTEIKDAVDHDQSVTLEQVKKVEDAIAGLIIDIGGEKIPIGELKDVPDLKKNVKIWQDIEEGNFKNHEKLTFITPKVAENLSKYQGELHLSGLTSLSNEAAESLSKHEERLYLHGLTSLSNEAAESLSKHEGYLYFRGLTSLSNEAAESLSKHQGWLELFGLTSLSNEAAESLSKHEEGVGLKSELKQQVDKFKKK